MSKHKTNSPSPSPSTVQDVAGPGETVSPVVQAMSEETAANVVEMAKAKGSRVNQFEREEVVATAGASEKITLLRDARASFQEAATLANESGEATEKALAVASKGGNLLFLGRARGLLSPDEVSTVLGDEFGWKGKGPKSGQRVTAAEPDATRSATPFGMGEHIRKRVVRASKAFAFVNGNVGEAGTFFKGLQPETVQPLLQPVLNGSESIWTLYDRLAKAKADAAGQRPKIALDPRRIASITATLAENIPASVKAMETTPGLFEAYSGLYRILGIIGREMPEKTANAA